MISLVFAVKFWKCFISRYHVDISRAFLRGKTITEQKMKFSLKFYSWLLNKYHREAFCKTN